MKKKLYIVSFGDSRKYRMWYEVPEGVDSLHKPDPFSAISERLKEKIHAECSEAGNLAYFVAPRATEIEPSHESKYASYPELNDEALAEIEKEVLKEVRERNAVKELNSDAPFSDVQA